MRGNLAAVVLLLTVALLSDDDRPSAAPPTSDIQEETFWDVFRVSRRRVERTSSSSWFPGARASPLGRLENRPLPQEIINIDIDDLSPKEEPALDESSSRSTESEWRPSKNDTQLMNDLHGGQWSLPGGSNVPMGWADPRLRGGRMLDVGISRYLLFSVLSSSQHIANHFVIPSIIVYSSSSWRTAQRHHLRSLRSIYPYHSRAPSLCPISGVLFRVLRASYWSTSHRRPWRFHAHR